MKLPAAIARKVQGLLVDLTTYADQTDALRKSDLDDLEEMAQRARYLLARMEPKRAPEKKLPGKSRQEKRTEKREQHQQATAQIREAVMRRARGRCELCGTPERPSDPLQLHHLRPGHGRRRQEQSAENCVAAHMTCHRRWHDGERSFRWACITRPSSKS